MSDLDEIKKADDDRQRQVVYLVQPPQASRELDAIDFGVLFQAREIGGVPLQFLHDFGLEIAAAEDAHHVQQARQCGAAVPRGVAGKMVPDLMEQEFEPEEGAYPFVKRLFVYDFF